MGGGTSRTQCGKDIECPTTVFKNRNQIGDKEQRRNLHIDNGELNVYEDDHADSLVLKINLDDRDLITSHEKKDGANIFTIREGDDVLQVYFREEEKMVEWTDRLNEEVSIAKTKQLAHCTKGLDRMMSMMSTFDTYDDASEPIGSTPTSHHLSDAVLPPPRMKIVILVVGTKGDVKPFINLGLALREQGHDVRVATHRQYREDVVSKDLKFYPLAGETTFCHASG